MSQRSAHIIHLSDLHMHLQRLDDDPIQLALFAALRAHANPTPDLVVVTGDVLDSGDVALDLAVQAVRRWRERLMEALGAEVPLVLLPGNHDRRHQGTLAPQQTQLFEALKAGLRHLPVWVSGCALPQLGELPPPGLLDALPFLLCSYDSTFIARGLMSAGGTLRTVDLLQVADQLRAADAALPLLLFMHHHLVPTPVTDTSVVDTGEQAPLLRFFINKIAPRLIANADREELFMTALGAGSALNLLHALGRAVLVLHGHKHCPTARLLCSPLAGSGDLLLVAAGSAGTAERWSPEGADEERPMALWPSFNAVSFQEGALAIDVVAFNPGDKPHARETVRYPLLRAEQAGAQWRLEAVPARPADLTGPAWALNQAAYALHPSEQSPQRWDVLCEREVHPRLLGPAPQRYDEAIELLPGAALERLDGGEGVILKLPGHARYWLRRGLCSTAREAQQALGPQGAFAHVELANRYHSELAVLSLQGPAELRPFASVMDLTNGQLSPAPLVREGTSWVLRRSACPARTQLRIHWPLSGA